MNAYFSKNDIYYDELINLITGNTDISSQYVIFTTVDDELFAINIAKVEELIRNKDIEISKSTCGNNATLGVAKIRDNFVSLLSFDKWIGKTVDDMSKLSLIILCNYFTLRIGLIVKNVVGIQSINPDTMYKGRDNDKKIAYTVEINIGKNKRLCSIFDSDSLIMELFPGLHTMNDDMVNKMAVNTAVSKEILVAEDSSTIQKYVIGMLKKANYNFKVFPNGKELYDYLLTINPKEIGLIVSDVEMPVMDGMALLRQLKSTPELKEIPVILHTNMANDAIADASRKIGALDVLKKLNLESLNEAIKKYSR